MVEQKRGDWETDEDNDKVCVEEGFQVPWAKLRRGDESGMIGKGVGRGLSLLDRAELDILIRIWCTEAVNKQAEGGIGRSYQKELGDSRNCKK